MKKKQHNNKRTIFIGDVHGCYDELLKLLEKLSFNSQFDQLIFLGDILNKGPKSKDVLLFVFQGGHSCILGNHEIGFLKGKLPHLKKELEETMDKSIFDNISKWIKQLPYYIETSDYIAVHGGLVPGKHPSECPKYDIASIRTWDGIGEDLQLKTNPPWYDYYNGEKVVIFGHWATKGLVQTDKYVGLDTGCVYGQKLSAFILEEKKIVQVDSFKEYVSLA